MRRRSHLLLRRSSLNVWSVTSVPRMPSYVLLILSLICLVSQTVLEARSALRNLLVPEAHSVPFAEELAQVVLHLAQQFQAFDLKASSGSRLRLYLVVEIESFVHLAALLTAV